MNVLSFWRKVKHLKKGGDTEAFPTVDILLLMYLHYHVVVVMWKDVLVLLALIKSKL